MNRLPITGSSVVSLVLGEDELKRVAEKLGAAPAYDDAETHDLYVKLARIHGRWWSELAAKEGSSVIKALGSIARDLTETTELLSGHDTGHRSAVTIETTSQIVRALERNSAVGSVETAHALIDGFKRDAAKIQEACLAALSDLVAGPSKRGRDALGWYDDFTDVLLEIATKTGARPTLRKDRVTGERSGWLLDAALALERFFHTDLRSPSPEACGKRLERSRKRLLNAHRQNQAAR